MLFLLFFIAILNFDIKKEIILFLFSRSLFQYYIGEKKVFNFPKQSNQSDFINMGNSAYVFMHASQFCLIRNLMLVKSFSL